MLAPSSALLSHIDIPPRLAASLIVLGICLVIWFFKAILSSPAKPPQAPPPGPPGQNPWGQPPGPPGANPYGQPPQQGYNPYGQQPPPGANPYAQQQASPPGANPYAQQPPAPGANPYAQQQPQQQAQQQPQTPFCGTCGGPGRWIPESNAWGCDRCRQLIQPR